MLDLFPDSASVSDGELTLGDLRASELADRFGTPLVVVCEETLVARAREYRASVPDAFVAYSVKAFPNVAVIRRLAAEGLGADVSTLGELAFARRAGIPDERIVMHGNNKSDEELRAAAGVAYVVLDAADEVERAVAAGVRRVLVRVTPGIDVDTHASIRTAHHGSKFGLPPPSAIAAIADALSAGLEVAGIHVHLGSQLRDTESARESVEWAAGFSAACRAEIDWTPRVLDVGGGLGVRHTADDSVPSISGFVGVVRDGVVAEWSAAGLDEPSLIVEPGRSVVGPAGVTLYRVGVVKEAGDETTYVAIDGGMSDNPRPQLYGARLSVAVAGRFDAQPDGRYTVAGKHCESGDVLAADVPLPAPRRGDVLAVPATGAYTLAMASQYNAVPRPAAVMVSGGEAQLIRRRETVEDLLALEP